MGIKQKWTFGNKTKTEIELLRMAQVLGGTVTTTGATGVTVNGTNTTFQTSYIVGDMIRVGDLSTGPTALSEVRRVNSIVSNTVLTVDLPFYGTWTGSTHGIDNPYRLKQGDTVFNIDDGVVMYYSGDYKNYWYRGDFIAGHCAAGVNGYAYLPLAEGMILQPSGAGLLQYGMITNDGTDPERALGLAYLKSRSGNCTNIGLLGMMTVQSLTATKGNFYAPGASPYHGYVGDSGTTPAAGDCGIIAISVTGPSGNGKMIADFIERL